jgi:hypothetical protein
VKFAEFLMNFVLSDARSSIIRPAVHRHRRLAIVLAERREQKTIYEFRVRLHGRQNRTKPAKMALKFLFALARIGSQMPKGGKVAHHPIATPDLC